MRLQAIRTAEKVINASAWVIGCGGVLVGWSLKDADKALSNVALFMVVAAVLVLVACVGCVYASVKKEKLLSQKIEMVDSNGMKFKVSVRGFFDGGWSMEKALSKKKQLEKDQKSGVEA
jgi:NADH:ubiquinone oxidoreductase subunit 4 (subunit M)